jgi:hypothetical protein
MCLRAKLEALERPMLSTETEQQVLRHQFSCSENLRELQKEDSSFLKDLHPFQEFVHPSTGEDTVHETVDTVHETVKSTRRLVESSALLTKNLLQSLSEASNQVQDKLYDDQLQYDLAILDWLAPSYSDRQPHLLHKAAEGSAKWFIDEPLFQAWIKGEYQDLWCYGSRESHLTNQEFY